MMNHDNKVQEVLFETIRQKLPQHLSLVNEIADLLEISCDSAYRRIRGSKKLSIEELKMLCDNYNISIDSLFGISSPNVLFEPLSMNKGEDGFDQYLNLLLAEIPYIQSGKCKEIIFAARDLPIFHFFEFPELIAFKIYFWKKMQFGLHDYLDKQFSLDDMAMHYVELGRNLQVLFNQIPTIEIWNNETFTRIFQQIEYCIESGFFNDKSDAMILCEKLELLIRHLHHQTEFGSKFLHGQEGIDSNEENFKVYSNKVIVIDNIIFVNRDGAKIIYMTYNSLGLLMTKNISFCSHMEQSLRTLMKTGDHISGTSALECNRFFNNLYDKVKLLKERVK